MDKINVLLSKVAALAAGEPARVIGYGAAAVIYLVAKIVRVIPDQTPEQALADATAALVVVAAVVESIRRKVTPA